MNKSSLHLSVLQFRLDKGLGYGYCKLLDFTSLDPWYGLIVKVFDFRTESPISDVQELQHAPYLLQPLIIGWPPSTEDGNEWNEIGKLIQDDDGICPIFKIAKERNHYSKYTKFNAKNWCPVYHFTEKGAVCDYDQLAHLETQHLGTSENVVNRATMEFLRKAGRNIEDYYYLEDNTFILEDYQRARQMPLYHKIPAKYRNAVIPPKKLSEIKHIPTLALCLTASWTL